SALAAVLVVEGVIRVVQTVGQRGAGGGRRGQFGGAGHGRPAGGGCGALALATPGNGRKLYRPATAGPAIAGARVPVSRGVRGRSAPAQVILNQQLKATVIRSPSPW